MLTVVPCNDKFKKELIENLVINLSNKQQSVNTIKNILKHRSIKDFSKPAAWLVIGAWEYKRNIANRVNAPSINSITNQIISISLTIKNFIKQLQILSDESKLILTSLGGADPEKFATAWESLAGPAIERDVPGAWDTEVAKLSKQISNIEIIANIALCSMEASVLFNNSNNGVKNYYENIQIRPPAHELALWVLRAITLSGQDRKHLEPITGAIHAWASGKPVSKKWNERGFREARKLIPEDPHTP